MFEFKANFQRKSESIETNSSHFAVALIVFSSYNNYVIRLKILDNEILALHRTPVAYDKGESQTITICRSVLWKFAAAN